MPPKGAVIGLEVSYWTEPDVAVDERICKAIATIGFHRLAVYYDAKDILRTILFGRDCPVAVESKP